MNKKIILSVSVAVFVVVLALLAVLRLTPIGHSHSLISDTVGLTVALLALPMRLYVMFVLGEGGNWPLPLFILFLGLSGAMWGLIVERACWVFSKLNTPSKI